MQTFFLTLFRSFFSFRGHSSRWVNRLCDIWRNSLHRENHISWTRNMIFIADRCSSSDSIFCAFLLHVVWLNSWELLLSWSHLRVLLSLSLFLKGEVPHQIDITISGTYAVIIPSSRSGFKQGLRLLLVIPRRVLHYTAVWLINEQSLWVFQHYWCICPGILRNQNCTPSDWQNRTFGLLRVVLAQPLVTCFYSFSSCL